MLPDSAGWWRWKPMPIAQTLVLWVCPTYEYDKQGHMLDPKPPQHWLVGVLVACLTSKEGFYINFIISRTVGSIGGRWGAKVSD